MNSWDQRETQDEFAFSFHSEWSSQQEYQFIYIFKKRSPNTNIVIIFNPLIWILKLLEEVGIL